MLCVFHWECGCAFYWAGRRHLDILAVALGANMGAQNTVTGLVCDFIPAANLASEFYERVTGRECHNQYSSLLLLAVENSITSPATLLDHYISKSFINQHQHLIPLYRFHSHIFWLCRDLNAGFLHKQVSQPNK